MRKPYLSVIIPCYNEAANLKRGVLTEVHKFLSNIKKLSWEVIISDDGSTDASRELVRSQIKGWKNFRLLENPHGGKPSALWYGIKAAKGRYVLFSDTDQSTPIDQLKKLLPHLNKGYDVVIGSRGIERKNFPLYRKLGAVVFMTIRKMAVLSQINDTQCGFKLFKKGLVKKAFPKLEFFRKARRAKGWTVTSYDVELLHILNKMGENIKEVEVIWDDKDVSKSKGTALSRYFRESREMLFQIIRVKLNDLKGVYD
jgi:glycosyltransferase involved in cell wall biosynthesis